MAKIFKKIGVLVPDILLPKSGTDYSKWAVVACDQYTSQPEYWDSARKYIGEEASTLDMILPEAYLGGPDEQNRIASIRSYMNQYISTGIIESKGEGFVLVSREAGGKSRKGLVLALDLEQYDYHKGSSSLIRATEATVESRIPPRLKIREGALIESPHILVLIDDPDKTVIEPIYSERASLSCLYDTDLMLNGGHITGWMVDKTDKVQSIANSLERLMDEDRFHQKYGEKYSPLLFAMGDGNHSLATAKAYWEKIKKEIPEIERENHPARFALVEIENVHDDGIVFEPIHRVVFGVDPDKFCDNLVSVMREQNGTVEITDEKLEAGSGNVHTIPFIVNNCQKTFIVKKPTSQLAVGTLQNAIDKVLSEQSGEVDYIHGEDVVRTLSRKENAIGFLLPSMKKEELFPTVVYDGALPRKTFSMGEANEKRYYMECRKIIK